MSRITKDIAAEIAEKLLEKKVKELNADHLKIQNLVRDFIISKTDEGLMKCFNNFDLKNYIQKTRYITLRGTGLNNDHIKLNECIPSINGNTMYLELPTDLAIQVSAMLMEDTRKNNNLNALDEELQATLYGLRTFKKVRESFPEAAIFLPEEADKKEIVNISLLRDKLK